MNVFAHSAPIRPVRATPLLLGRKWGWQDKEQGAGGGFQDVGPDLALWAVCVGGGGGADAALCPGAFSPLLVVRLGYYRCHGINFTCSCRWELKPRWFRITNIDISVI